MGIESKFTGNVEDVVGYRTNNIVLYDLPSGATWKISTFKAININKSCVNGPWLPIAMLNLSETICFLKLGDTIHRIFLRQ